MNGSNPLVREIDRLIDGELSEQEITQLLQRCDADPAAWKALALGFMEAREVSHVLKELIEAPEPVVSASSPSWYGRRLVTLALSAACLACIGFLTGWFASKPQPLPRRALATSAISQLPALEENAKTDVPEKPSDGLAVVGFAQIYNRIGKEPPVPVIAGRDLDFLALLQQSPKVPEHIRRQYKNQGLAIQADRRVMSLELADGQRFAIPLDKLGVRFVGHEVL